MDKTAKTNSAPILTQINQGPMSTFQVVVIAICVLISALDGFDVLTMAFTSPYISKEWQLKPDQLGLLFSAGLAGMSIGSVLLAPFADRYGRRLIVLLSLTCIGISMIGAAHTSTILTLGTARFLTGLGIGAVLPSLNVMVAEYASHKWRDFSISVLTVGYAAGAVLGGVIAVYLIRHFGWPAVFTFGGVLTLLLVPLVWFSMPDSIAWLITRPTASALPQVNKTLMRMGYKKLDQMPNISQNSHGGKPARYSDLLKPNLIISTILACLCYLLMMGSFHVLISWMPKMLVELGLSPENGVTGSILMSLFGVPGGMALGWLSRRVGFSTISVIYMLMLFIVVALFSFVPQQTAILLTITSITGFFCYGTVVSLYALAPRAFPTQIRATGAGLALGFGRLGGTLGPYILGLILASGVQPATSLIIVTIPVIIAIFLFPLAVRYGAGERVD